MFRPMVVPRLDPYRGHSVVHVHTYVRTYNVFLPNVVRCTRMLLHIGSHWGGHMLVVKPRR